MFTILLVTNNADITSSKLSRILRTKLAFFSPFFNFKSILALFVAVRAVSEPERNADKTINKNKQIISKKENNDIYLSIFFIFFKLTLVFKKALPIPLSNTKFIFPSIFFLSL